MDLVFSPAFALAGAIRRKEVSALQVLEAHLAHIAKHNPALNAIVTLDTDGARRRAAEADVALARGEVWGPLHGVPVTVKDAFETAQLRTTASSRRLARYVPTRDAAVVTRLRIAGAVVLGKTNMPYLGRGFQCASPVFGRANNPWHVGRTPGGSAGGGAAAVAAGLSPLEVSSDIGGSIRIPAHFCGVFGLKPTEGRISTTGHIPEMPGRPRTIRHMLAVGALARSVPDLRLALGVLAGSDPRQPAGDASSEGAPAPALRNCRLAWTDSLGGLPVSADTRRALENLAQTLAGLSARIERRSPPGFDFHMAWLTYGEILGYEMGASQSRLERFADELAFAGFAALQRIVFGEAPIIEGWRRGLSLSTICYNEALARRDGFIAQLDAFLAERDAWICPVSVRSAFTHRPDGLPLEVDGQRVPYEVGVAHCVAFNLTGHPVVVVPVGLSSDGLPLGVQLVGPRGGEMTLLTIGDQVAEVTGGYRRPPGY